MSPSFFEMAKYCDMFGGNSKNIGIGSAKFRLMNAPFKCILVRNRVSKEKAPC